MLRRSNSISNIPLSKTNLFGGRESKGGGSRRSQSTTRLTSQRDSLASASQLPVPRKSSLDRRFSNNPGLPRLTPLQKSGNRGSILQKATPSSTVSQRSARVTTPASSLKDRVTIQKLANDKKWVAEKYVKVQNFIATSSLFDPAFLSSNTLKPPSTKAFVFVTATLFKEIFPRIKITNENYKEVIPAQLKVLRYPGTLTNSLLKTVNTMHSWPQIVALWSWLIDKVNLSQCADDLEDLDHLKPEEKQKRVLKQNCQDYLMKRYANFNNNDNSAEVVKKVSDKYVKNLAEILEVDFAQFNGLQAETLEKRQHRDKQLQDIEHLAVETQKKQVRIDEMRKEITNFEEFDAIEEQEVENELQLLQINLNDLSESKDATRRNIQQLEVAKKAQPCTYQEKLALLREIAELKGQNEVKKEKIEHARNIKNKFDHQLTNEISKIQAIVIQWNRSLMEVSIEKPELKKLLLREKGFHDPNFLNEMQQVLQYKIAIENEVAKSLVKVEFNLVSVEQKKQDVENEIAEKSQILIRNNKECIQLSENITRVKMDAKDLAAELDEKCRVNAEQTQKLKDTWKGNLAVEAAEINDLNQGKEALEVEVKTFSQKMLSFFVDMSNQVANNIREMDAIRKSVLRNVEAKSLRAVEQHKGLLEALKSFESLKAIEQSFEVADK